MRSKEFVFEVGTVGTIGTVGTVPSSKSIQSINSTTTVAQNISDKLKGIEDPLQNDEEDVPMGQKSQQAISNNQKSAVTSIPSTVSSAFPKPGTKFVHPKFGNITVLPPNPNQKGALQLDIPKLGGRISWIPGTSIAK